MKKKIEKVSEAAAVLSVKSACQRGRSMRNCARCPLTVYEGGKIPNCGEVVGEAIDFLMQNIVADDETGKFEPLYKKVCGLGYKGVELPEVIETVDVLEVPVPNCQGTCSECSRKKLIGGMVFCQAFHNFTHPDGYCYRYEPVDKSSQ